MALAYEMTDDRREELRRAVAKGCARLPKVMPGWEMKIVLPKFNISDCRACILGQLYGSYAKGIEALMELQILAEDLDTYDFWESYEVLEAEGFDIPTPILAGWDAYFVYEDHEAEALGCVLPEYARAICGVFWAEHIQRVQEDISHG